MILRRMSTIAFAVLSCVMLGTSARAQAGSPPPAKLDTVKTTDRAPGRVLVGRDAFDERRYRGFGHFYDSTELSKRSVAHLDGLLQGENGLAVVRPPICTPPGPAMNPNIHHNNCVTSSAARVAVTRGFCAMKLLLDGRVLSDGGEIDTRDTNFDRRHNWMTVLDLDTVDLGSMEKIEVYRRSEEIPLEFKGNDTECGLIVLWSRR